MSIWILAILMIACVAVAGWRQGAIHAAFSTVGILFGLLLGGLVGKIFHWVLPFLGVSNPVFVWLLAPVCGFILIVILFKIAGFKVHTQVDVYYKYKAGDLRLAMWQRLNTRLGISVGMVNGALYFLAVCFVIFNLSYWTVQAASAAKPQAALTRLVNQLGSDLQSSGFARSAAALHILPPNYYRLADLTGILMQNPPTGARVADYPGLTALWQRQDIQPLATDGGVTGSLASDATLHDILNEPPVEDFLKNKTLTTLVLNTLAANFDDFTNYLVTGKSAKYDGKKILGRWAFNVNVSLAWLRQDRPKILASEMGAIRTLWTQAYAKTTILVTGDNQVFIKSLPRINCQPGPPQLDDWKGDWSLDGNNYTVHVTCNGEDKFLAVSATDLRLTVKDGRSLLIFDRVD